MAKGGGLVLRGGHDAVGPVVGHAHDVLAGHQTLGLLLGVLHEPLGLGTSLRQDGVGVGDDLLGAVNGGGDRVTGPVDEVLRGLPVDDRGGAHRHRAGMGDEIIELIEDVQQVVSGIAAGRHGRSSRVWSAPTMRPGWVLVGRVPEARPC